MHLSGLFSRKRHAFLVVVPLVALALIGSAAAQTKPKQPPTGTQTSQANPAPKLKLDTDANQGGTSQGAAQSTTSTAQPSAKGAGDAQSAKSTAQPATPAQPATGTQSAENPAQEKKASQPVEEGMQPLSPNPKQIVVNIDKSTQEATVFVDGVEQYNWKVSTGKPGHITPSGTYTATSMNEIWYSKEWDNAPMPHAVFFMKDGHAIHGTAEVKNLGKPASHGCVRLAPENATILFNLVKENGLQNTKVVLSGETPGGEYEGVATARPQYPYPYGYGYGRGQAFAPPWFNGGEQAQIQPDQQPQPRRRGFFKRWFQQNYGDQGYYAPPRYYQRGYGY
jgi:lipoprotein-anchoring transpeptidase ErfK/SrfK